MNIANGIGDMEVVTEVFENTPLGHKKVTTVDRRPKSTGDTMGSASADEDLQNERLDRIEHNLEVLIGACKEMAKGLDGHQTVLLALLELPGDVSNLLQSIVQEQAKVNFAAAIKNDQLTELVSELQEEVAELFADAGTTIDNVAYTYDIETDGVDLDLTNVFEDTDEDDGPDLLRVEGEFLMVTMPTLSAVPDAVGLANVIEHLNMLAFFAAEDELIADETADIIFNGLSPDVTEEDAQKFFVELTATGLAEALQEWWEAGSVPGHEAVIGVHLGSDVGAAIHQIIASIALNATMAHMVYSLMTAINED
ncbi:hypothetical protein vBRpoSV10_203 [Ruegeria phage vB_RpoS-V10]|nr:hypothetical protein vBRpoSV10_203 [Ruegeria phage vB_RpoS-V10]